MPDRRLDSPALLDWADAAVAALIAHADEINRLNVFPVADADTGRLDGYFDAVLLIEVVEHLDDDALAHVLVHDLGLVSGNRVLCRGFNGRFMTVAWLATLKAGMVAVSTMPMLRAGELRMVIERAQCNAALCDARLLEELASAAAGTPSIRAVRCWGGEGADALERAMARHTGAFPAVATASDDVALIAFTSGTTGVPKGCMHFHRDVMAMCRGFAEQVLGITADDRCIGTPPIAFTFGLGGLVCFPMAARASAMYVCRVPVITERHCSSAPWLGSPVC